MQPNVTVTVSVSTLNMEADLHRHAYAAKGLEGIKCQRLLERKVVNLIGKWDVCTLMVKLERRDEMSECSCIYTAR